MMRSCRCVVGALLLVLTTGLRAGAVGPTFAGDRDRWVGAEILLRDPNVLKDLGLGDQQAFRARLALTAAVAQFTEDLQRIQGLKGEEWKAKQREIAAKVPDRELDLLAKHLSASQLKRLREITYQTAGIDAFAHAEVLKQIDPTPEQKDKLKAIAAELETNLKEVKKLFEAGRIEPALKKEEELRAEAMKKVQELLTEKQKMTWQELTGKAIRLQGAKKP